MQQSLERLARATVNKVTHRRIRSGAAFGGGASNSLDTERFAQKVQRRQYSTASEATGCDTKLQIKVLCGVRRFAAGLDCLLRRMHNQEKDARGTLRLRRSEQQRKVFGSDRYCRELFASSSLPNGEFFFDVRVKYSEQSNADIERLARNSIRKPRS